MAHQNKPVLPTNRHKFKKPIRGNIVSKQSSINNFEDLKVVLNKNEAIASEDTIISIKINAEEYELTIPLADEIQIMQFQNMITECLNMSADEFDLFEDNFPKVVEAQFGIHDIEMAEELTNIVALIRSEHMNQEPSIFLEAVQPQPETQMQDNQPEPVKAAPVSEPTPEKLGSMASIVKTMGDFLVKMGKPQPVKS